MKKINMEDIDCLPFWINYFGCCYPNAYDAEEEISASDLMMELFTDKVGNWWNAFTGYDDDILDENDGYLEEPATLITTLPQGKTLKIEFHPGDILYFINDEQIGSTGPHWKLQTMPFRDIEQLLSLEKGRQLFLLLLPLAVLDNEKDHESVRKKIAQQMHNYFPEHLCESVSRCIVAGFATPNDHCV